MSGVDAMPLGSGPVILVALRYLSTVTSGEGVGEGGGVVAGPRRVF